MDTVVTRTGDAPALEAPKGGTPGATRMLGRLLLTMAQTTAERVILPQCDSPPEWFRHPLP